jgi:glycerol-3-phosphate acyltransferase PlsY
MLFDSSFLSGLIALLVGYFLGSIPTAYLVTRWKTGKDIRKLGGGNVGGLNTWKEVGVVAAIIVAIVDVGKGALTVAVTYSLLDLDKTYVLISAIGAVVGHNWMPWLKFTGGKGMGVTIGVLVVVLPVYSYLLELAIFAGIIIVMLVITRNVALSNGVALLGLPFICWLSIHSGLMVVWSVVLGLIILAKFIPTAISALSKDSNIKHYIKGS